MANITEKVFIVYYKQAFRPVWKYFPARKSAQEWGENNDWECGGQAGKFWVLEAKLVYPIRLRMKGVEFLKQKYAKAKITNKKSSQKTAKRA